MTTHLNTQTMPDGKRRLIDAALRLAAQGTSFSSMGLRELGREAGLNHNTFYRHFRNTDELSATAVHEIARDIMIAMKKIRLSSAKNADATVSAAEYFYNFVMQHPQIFFVCVRELNSSGAQMRTVMKTVVHQIAVESVDQITSLNLVEGLSREALLEATTAITHYLFYRSLDYIEYSEQRDQILIETIRFIRAQFMGMVALEEVMKKS